MTSQLFESYLRDLNKKVMEKRQILLIVDNASCHNSGMEVELSHVKVKFLPPNTTSIMQPLDMGVMIEAFKAHYRQLMNRLIITELDKLDKTANATCLAKKITLLQGIEFAVEAWNEISETTIQNCWRKGGLCFGPLQKEVAPERHPIDDRMDPEVFERWVRCDEDLETGPSDFATDEQIVDDIQAQFNEDKSEDESESDDENVQEEPVSSTDALKAIECLKRFLLQKNESSADLMSLDRIKRHVTSSITFQQSMLERFLQLIGLKS